MKPVSRQRRSLYLILAAVIVAGLVLYILRKPGAGDRLAAEREVYAHLLGEQKSKHPKEILPIVEYTNSGELRGSVPENSAATETKMPELRGLERGVWADFEKINERPYPVRDFLPPQTELAFIDPAASEQLGWWLSFSRVGFDRSLKQALVLVGECRGNACYDSTSDIIHSEGSYVLLEKTPEGWTVKAQETAWLVERPSP